MAESVIEAVPFAVYVTALADADELREATRVGSLSADAAWALHLVDAALERHPIQLKSEIDRLRDYFAEYDDAAETTRATAIRVRCGGGLPHLRASEPDSLAGHLAVLARDMFPLFLLQPSEDGYSIDPYGAPSWDRHWGLDVGVPHPVAERFLDLIKEQSWFSAALSGAEFSERVDVGRFKSGWYRGVRLRSFHTSLLNDAFRTTAGTGPFTADRFIQAALRALSAFEQTMVGGKIDVAVLHGLTGVHLGEGVRVDLPWGTLRQMREAEVGLLHDSFHHRGRDQVSRTTVVMEGSGVLTRTPGHAPSSWFESRTPSGLDELERLQLGLLLASEGRGTAAAVWCASPDVAHLDHIPDERDAFLLPYMAADFGSLDSPEVEGVGYWCALVDANHRSEIDTAARRLLRARLERLRPDDGLVDAVIALESLFAGSSQTEITFRVSTAVAWLLSPHDAQDRKVVSINVKRLYATRSAIVHGGRRNRPLDAETTPWQERDAAVVLVVRCLMALYRDQPHLIAEKNRGEMLTLGMANGAPA